MDFIFRRNENTSPLSPASSRRVTVAERGCVHNGAHAGQRHEGSSAATDHRTGAGNGRRISLKLLWRVGTGEAHAAAMIDDGPVVLFAVGWSVVYECIGDESE